MALSHLYIGKKVSLCGVMENESNDGKMMIKQQRIATWLSFVVDFLILN
ncbi:hypothetical protein HDF26_001602 [Pedobacter cryoconitis]|nr:hypothetical protein [Pedobacter cryoconitis]MBB6271175.1 hypothetical protein [Pedobacter cryoconitis]